MIDLGKIKQGERGTLTITWEFPDSLTSPASIAAATITAVMENMDTGDVTAVSGTLTATGATSATWALSAGDSGTAGTFHVTFRADVSGTPTYTLNAALEVEENPAATAVQNPALVGISSAEAAWLTAGKTAVPDAADLVDANDLGTAAYAATGDFDAAGSAAAAIAESTANDTVAANGRIALLDRIAALEAELFADPAPGTVVSDEFTDADATALSSHAIAPINTVSTAWSYLAGTFAIYANKAVCMTKTGNLGLAVVDSGLADCVINATITYIGSNTGLIIRADSVSSFLLIALGSPSYIIKFDGSTTILVNKAFTPVVGVDYAITVLLSGNNISVDVNSGALSMSASNAYNNTATKHGLYCENILRTWNDFSVKGYSSTPLTAGLYSWYNTLQAVDKSTHIETSFLSSWIVYTDATTLLVNTYSNHTSNTDWMRVAYRVDDGTWHVLTPSATGAAQFTITTGSGQKKKVEFLAGAQSKPASTILGAWPVSLVHDGTYCVDGSPTSQFSSSMVIYGDSITSGDGADVEVTEGYATLLRDALPEHPVVCEAWGYRSLYDDANTAGLIDALVAKIAAISPAIIWLAIGTNDYGLNKWTAAAFGAAYEALLTDLVAALPSARIYCMCPLHRTNESANGSGNTLEDYRTALEMAVTNIANANVTYVDASAWLGDGDLADGVHPSTAGHAIVAAQILAAMD